MEGDTTGTKGSMTYKMALNGLWLTSEFKGSFGGMEFEGRGLDTYDPASKQYVSVWVDSMGTMPLILKGEFDEEKHVMTMVGETAGPDGTPMKMKTVTEYIDLDNMTFSIHMLGPDGADAGQMMKITYTRVKDDAAASAKSAGKAKAKKEEKKKE
jgi:hypothetical protein